MRKLSRSRRFVRYCAQRYKVTAVAAQSILRDVDVMRVLEDGDLEWVPRDTLTRVFAERVDVLEPVLQGLVDGGLITAKQERGVKGRGRKVYRASRRRGQQRKVRYAGVRLSETSPVYDELTWWIFEMLRTTPNATVHLKDICWTLRNRVTAQGIRYSYRQVSDHVRDLAKLGLVTMLTGELALAYLGRTPGPGKRPILVQVNKKTPALGDRPNVEAVLAREDAEVRRVKASPKVTVPASAKRVGRPSKAEQLAKMTPLERLEEAVKRQDLDLVPPLPDLPAIGGTEWADLVTYDQALLVARKYFTRGAVPDGFYSGKEKESVQRTRLKLGKRKVSGGTEGAPPDIQELRNRRIRYADEAEARPHLEVMDGGVDADEFDQDLDV